MGIPTVATDFRVVLTPSCDMVTFRRVVSAKVSSVLVAKCASIKKLLHKYGRLVSGNMNSDTEV